MGSLHGETALAAFGSYAIEGRCCAAARLVATVSNEDFFEHIFKAFSMEQSVSVAIAGNAPPQAVHGVRQSGAKQPAAC